ncbi:MAG: hypothetical protein HQ547_06735 [Candidatus Omnitrophica bacterium]|nr:hypothetical protein [Candidatus Omnitrophota bacterium]
MFEKVAQKPDHNRGAIRTGKTETPEEREIRTKIEANRALLSYVVTVMNLKEGEVSIDEETGRFVFSDPAIQEAYVNRGTHNATYMHERGLIPEEMIDDKKAFREAQYSVVYNMLHMVRTINGGRDELHVATHFPGEATYEGTNLFKTTGSHFQGKSFDFKYVKEGYGLQLIIYETRNGKMIVKAIPLYPGAVAVSLPGTIDIVVNFGGLNFTDRSFEVSNDKAMAIAKTLSLSGRFQRAMSDEKAAKTLMEELPAKGMPFIFCEEDGKPMLKIHPVYADMLSIEGMLDIGIAKIFSPSFTYEGNRVPLSANVEAIFKPFNYNDTNIDVYTTYFKDALEETLPTYAIGELVFPENLVGIRGSLIANLWQSIDISQAVPHFASQKAFEKGSPALLSPSMTEKPWGARVESERKLIGEYEYTGSASNISIPKIPGVNLDLYQTIAQNPAAILGQGVVDAFGTKPILLKRLTPGHRERVSDLSRQVHDTKNELWVVTKTTVDNPQIILGFNPEKLRMFEAKEGFLKAYEAALVEYSEALEMVNNEIMNRYPGGEKVLEDFGNTMRFILLDDLQIMLLNENKLKILEDAESQLTSFYNFVPVKAGDVIPIPVGTVHALLHGVEVIEPQIEGRTLPIEDGARYPIRYNIKTKDGKVESIKGISAEEVFNAMEVAEYKPTLPEVLSERNGVKVEELGTFPGLTVQRVTFDNTFFSHNETTKNGYHVVVATKGEVQVITQTGQITLKEGEEPVFIPASTGVYPVIANSKGAQIIKSFVPVEETQVAQVSPAEEPMTAEDIYKKSTEPDRDALRGFLTHEVLKGTLDKRAVIVAYDTGLEKDIHTGQVAQAGESSINKYMDGNFISIRATGQKLCDYIDQAISELNIPYAVVTIAGNETVEQVGGDLTKKGKVLNIQNGDGRYISVIGLHELAFRIANESNVNDILTCLNRIGFTVDNRPFTKADVESLRINGILGILPKIVVVNWSEKIKAYKRAQEVLKHL